MLCCYAACVYADTDVESTNFHFDVKRDSLSGALDRFAQFFIEPLFTESATERELNAIESEHSKNLQSDRGSALAAVKLKG